MLGARLRQLAACTRRIALLLVNHREVIFGFVPQRVGLGGRILDCGPPLVCILPVVLLLRPASQTCVRIGPSWVGFHDFLEDLFRLVALTCSLKSLRIDRQRTGETLDWNLALI